MCPLITHRFLSVNVAGDGTSRILWKNLQYPVLYIRLTSNVKQSFQLSAVATCLVRDWGVPCQAVLSFAKSIQSLLSLPKPFVFANLFPVDLRACF